ncbi:hypothetical protein SARC_08759 [Sphaeroforma arctica JP610]|uniref:Reelin domain-containing protein n=1 Tax=Sphaeroforma arctica JP610 TaxID=667725 RepID=A0A0L0FQ26_9EUKA|nr:hypothetical protein SARC_08759 [Sphaeroforma arctica JP610]KNC78824.1 hypothetical protein SARC_08759 [Sphaeroforma arctica JP610]|eukprot:XP_014152726.1 hypothetical protein SARC_08759 [Sphaeroforma arctica JP610]
MIARFLALAAFAASSFAGHQIGGHWSGTKICEVIVQSDNITQTLQNYTIEVDIEQNPLDLSKFTFSTTHNESNTLIYAGTISNPALAFSLCNREMGDFESGLFFNYVIANTSVLVGTSTAYHPELFSPGSTFAAARCYWEIEYVMISTAQAVPSCSDVSNVTLNEPGTLNDTFNGPGAGNDTFIGPGANNDTFTGPGIVLNDTFNDPDASNGSLNAPDNDNTATPPTTGATP